MIPLLFKKYFKINFVNLEIIQIFMFNIENKQKGNYLWERN